MSFLLLGHQSLISLVYLSNCFCLRVSVANLIVAGVTESLWSRGSQETLLVRGRIAHTLAEIFGGAG